MNDLQRQLIAAFQTEFPQHVEGIRQALAALAAAPEAGRRAILDEAFRCAHTLKGAARAADLTALELLSHRMETIMGRVRDGSLAPDENVRGVITRVLDAMEDWLAANENDPVAGVPTDIMQEVEALLGAGLEIPVVIAPTASQEEALLAALAEPLSPVPPVPEQTLPESPAVEPTLAPVPEPSREAVASPDPEPVADDPPPTVTDDPSQTVAGEPPPPAPSPLFAAPAEIPAEAARASFAPSQGSAALASVPAAIPDAVVPAKPPPRERPPLVLVTSQPSEPVAEAPAERRKETIQINSDNLEFLFHSLSELLAETQRQDHVVREVQALAGAVGDLAREWETVRRDAGALLRDLSVRPEYRRIATYLDASGHRIRSLSKQARAVAQLEGRSAWSLKVVGQKMQGDVNRICMVPAQTVYLGFRKMVRDLAREAGKEVEFEAEGLDVQADRMVLQALKDPLMHLIRNCLAHGIEMPEERVAKGKPRAGTIRLQIEAVANRLRVTLEDDGRGIDVEKIERVAREKLMIGIEESPTPQEIRRIIFRPGFSTADALTSLAGRGMGMSVVQHEVARLSGEVDVVEKETPGTRFVLSVPIASATSRILLVKAGGKVFGIPVNGIERLHRVKRSEVTTLDGKPAVTLHGETLRLARLADLLHIGEAADDTSPCLYVVVLKALGARIAIRVEAFLEEKESQIRDLGAIAARNEMILGANILDDGTLSLTLDPAGLLSALDGPKVDITAIPIPALEEEEVDEPKRRRRILVVDDSITTRTLEKSILEANGYDVSLATDGIEALERLRAETFELVVTDLEMPRMNGFGLIEAMKSDDHLQKLPVIMVTSRDSDADRERGLALGADAYVVKQKFDQTDLLETVQQLL